MNPPEPSEEYRSFPAYSSNKLRAPIDPCPIYNFRGCKEVSCPALKGLGISNREDPGVLYTC